MFKNMEVNKLSIRGFYNNRRNIFIIFVLGTIFILMSNIIKKSQIKYNNLRPTSTQEFVTKIQDDLSNMISNIEGAGKSKVLVTIEEGEEIVYATEKKQNTQTITDEGSNNNQFSKKHIDDSEKKYIITKDASGNEKPMIVKKIEPKIRGAIVSCQGAKNKEVRENIVKLVSIALDISPNKICVIKFRK